MKLYSIILLLVFLGCGDKTREEVTQRYPDGRKKIVMKFKGEGSKEQLIEKIVYSTDGDTIEIERPLENYHFLKSFKEVYLEYPNGKKMVEKNFIFSADEQKNIISEEIIFNINGDTIYYANFLDNFFYSQTFDSTYNRLRKTRNNGQNMYDFFDINNKSIYFDDKLSKHTQDIVKSVKSDLNIKVYFTPDLPGEYGFYKKYIDLLLTSIKNISPDKIDYHFNDIESEEDIERAGEIGIEPVQLQVIENDKVEVRRIHMGVVFHYENKEKIIPTISSLDGLEYQFISIIKTLLNKNKKTIGIVSRFNQTYSNDNLNGILNQNYSVKNISLNSELPEDIKVLLMNGITNSLRLEENLILKSYLKSGGNLFIAQNRIEVNIQTQEATPIESNIFDILSNYGLQIKENLVLDKNCGKVNVQQNMGMMKMAVPMDYPFLPIIKEYNESEIIVSGLDGLRTMFPSEIILDGRNSVTKLFWTSSNSSTMSEFYNLSPDPTINDIFSELYESGKIISAIAKTKGNNIDGGEIVLVSDSNFFADNGGGGSPDNHIFVLNTIDYLLSDSELIELRNKKIHEKIHKHYTDLINMEVNHTLKSYSSTSKWINSP